MRNKINIVFLAMPVVFSAEVHSVESVATQLVQGSPVINSDPMSSGYLTQLFLGLLVVVLCIVALAWFAKKMNRFHSSVDDSLKIISGISMGTRERIVLLQVGEEQLLVGVSPGRINKLHVLNTAISSPAKTSSETGKNERFADKLKTMMLDASSKAKN